MNAMRRIITPNATVTHILTQEVMNFLIQLIHTCFKEALRRKLFKLSWLKGKRRIIVAVIRVPDFPAGAARTIDTAIYRDGELNGAESVVRKSAPANP